MVAICINRIKQTLPKMNNLTLFFICVFVLLLASVSACIISTKGQPIQGGLMLFKTAGATNIQLDGVLININSENGFVIGFHRDDTEVQILSGVCPDGVSFIIKLKPKQKPHYVDNKKFLGAMIEHRLKCQKAEDKKRKAPEVTNYIGECFLKIANHLSYRTNFINYTYRDDMISDCIVNCLQYMRNFNPENSNNPFAYFTQIIYYAFIRRIQKEKKQSMLLNINNLIYRLEPNDKELRILASIISTLSKKKYESLIDK